MNLRNGSIYGKSHNSDGIGSIGRSKSHEMQTRTESKRKYRNLTSDAIPNRDNSEFHQKIIKTEPKDISLNSSAAFNRSIANTVKVDKSASSSQSLQASAFNRSNFNSDDDTINEVVSPSQSLQAFAFNRSNVNSYDDTINEVVSPSQSLQAASYRIKRECLDLVERSRLHHNQSAQCEKPPAAKTILHKLNKRSRPSPKSKIGAQLVKRKTTPLQIILVDILKSNGSSDIANTYDFKSEIKTEITAPTSDAQAPRRSERLRFKPRIPVVFKQETKGNYISSRVRKVKVEPSSSLTNSNIVLEEASINQSAFIMPKDKELNVPRFLARKPNLAKQKQLSPCIKIEDLSDVNVTTLNNNDVGTSLIPKNPAPSSPFNHVISLREVNGNATILNGNDIETILPIPKKRAPLQPSDQENSDHEANKNPTILNGIDIDAAELLSKKRAPLQPNDHEANKNPTILNGNDIDAAELFRKKRAPLQPCNQQHSNHKANKNATILNGSDIEGAALFRKKLALSPPLNQEIADFDISDHAIIDTSESDSDIDDASCDDTNDEMKVSVSEPKDKGVTSWKFKTALNGFNYDESPSSPDPAIENMETDDCAEISEEEEDCAADLAEYQALVRQKYMEALRSRHPTKSLFDLPDDDTDKLIKNDGDDDDDVESLFGDMSCSDDGNDSKGETEKKNCVPNEMLPNMYASEDKNSPVTMEHEDSSANLCWPQTENNIFNSSMSCPQNIFGFLNTLLEQQAIPSSAAESAETMNITAPRRVLYSREIFGDLCEQFLKGNCSEELFCLHTHQLPEIETVQENLDMAAIDVVNEAFSNILICNSQLYSQYFGVFAEYYGMKKERRQLQIMLQYCKDPAYNLCNKLKDVVNAFVASGMEYHSVIDLILSKLKLGVQPVDYHFLLEIIVDERNTNAGIHCNCQEFKDIFYRNDFSFVVEFLDRIIALAVKKRYIDLVSFSMLSLQNCTVTTFKSLNQNTVEQFLALCDVYKLVLNENVIKSIQLRFDQFNQPLTIY